MRSRQNRLKVLISGAGIGGLTAALCLRQKGFAVEVFERTTVQDRTGAGIQLSPNAMQVLNALGLAEAAAAAAFEPEAATLRHYRTGKPCLSIPLQEICRKRYGAPYLHIHRASLIDILIQASQKAGAVIHPDTEVLGYSHMKAGIAVQLKDRPAQKADLLIGADGMHSVVRDRMAGHSTPEFTGQTAWRGLVRADALPEGTIPTHANVWLGPGRHFVAYHLDGTLINFVAVKERTGWQSESWYEKGDMEELRRTFSGWDERIGTLLQACRKCLLWGLFDRPSLPGWSDGRAVLLGDACHPILPFMAQGGAMAIEDAWILAAQLAEQSPERAFERYEALRRPRTRMLKEMSEANAGLFHLSGRRERFFRAVRFFVGRSLPRLALRPLDRIYRFDATKTQAG